MSVVGVFGTLVVADGVGGIVVVETSAVVYKAALRGVIRPWYALWPCVGVGNRVGVVWCWGLFSGCTVSGLLAVLPSIVVSVHGASASVYVWQRPCARGPAGCQGFQGRCQEKVALEVL